MTTQRVRTALDAALGVSLVHYFPPKHHSRASNLLNAVLKVQPVNSEARFARGQIFETAGNWSEAKKNFEMILNVTEPDQSEAQQIQDAADLVISKDAEEDKRLTRSIVGAKEEIGWCLVNEGKLEKGREVLEEVVELRDTRHEQGGKEDEALARARAWWRLGRAEWMIGGQLPFSNPPYGADDPFGRCGKQTTCRRMVHRLHPSLIEFRACIHLSRVFLSRPHTTRYRESIEVLPKGIRIGCDGSGSCQKASSRICR